MSRRAGEPSGGAERASEPSGGAERSERADRHDGLSDRVALRAQLIEARIAGAVGTSREVNLRSYRRLAEGNRGSAFGLEFGHAWTPAEVLEVMARRVGVSPDPSFTEGVDRIDPDRTLESLDAAAAVIGAAARARARVLVSTGHPGGLLGVHLAIVGMLRAAGADLLTPSAGWRYCEHRRDEERPRQIRYIDAVAMVSGRGELNHTHSAVPMQAMLAELAAGCGLPDLVVADHGWAGAAAQAGCQVVSFADCNDPGLFVGQEEGKVGVVVPLDDNVEPHRYLPLTRYLISAATAG